MAAFLETVSCERQEPLESMKLSVLLFCLVLHCWKVLCSGSDCKPDPVQELISVAAFHFGAFSPERVLDPRIGPQDTVRTGAEKWQQAASRNEFIVQPCRTTLHRVPVLVSLSCMTAVQDIEVLFRSLNRFSESSCNRISQHRELTDSVPEKMLFH